jgi:hypothetical protein
MTWPVSSGRVRISELLDLVGAVGDEAEAVGEGVRHVYDWHNSRSVTGMQLTFAPAATAILTIVVKPDSRPLIIVAGIVVLVTLVLGVFQLLSLNWLHGEYVYALRLAVELRAFHAELRAYPHGIGAPTGSPAHVLYHEFGPVSMVTYRTDLKRRKHVLDRLSEFRAQARAAEGASAGANG